MIGRKSPKSTKTDAAAPQGFDDFDIRLGDMMRGERATLGKSLLDVQRELRIKASYIAAIENCDPTAFDTPGFIAGYVRSYARYLGLDPDEAFDHFCAESGFSVAHGMSEKASSVRKAQDEDAAPKVRDVLAEPKLPFAVNNETVFSRIEPGAIGSSLVLLVLLGGLGYGGWSVLQEVQRVQLAPVDQTPVVLSELDPLDAARQSTVSPEQDVAAGAGVFTPPSSEAFDRLYRPQALDVPVLVARDAPISTLDPEAVGVFAGLSGVPTEPKFTGIDDIAPLADASKITDPEAVNVVAVRPAWVRVSDSEGAVLFSGILNGGDSFAVPRDAVDPMIEIGESGAVYFAVNGVAHGPAGPRGSVTSDVLLTAEAVTATYAVADPASETGLAPILAGLAPAPAAPLDPVAAAIAAASQAADPSAIDQTPMPKVLADGLPGVTIVASREAWVRVKAPSGATLFEAIMQAGESYNVPQTEQAPTIRTGDAGAIYFAVNGQTFGPYGGNGQIADNLALSPQVVSDKMAVADLTENATLASIVAQLGNVEALE